jgi:hypothetical protein
MPPWSRTRWTQPASRTSSPTVRAQRGAGLGAVAVHGRSSGWSGRSIATDGGSQAERPAPFFGSKYPGGSGGSAPGGVHQHRRHESPQRVPDREPHAPEVLAPQHLLAREAPLQHLLAQHPRQASAAQRRRPPPLRPVPEHRRNRALTDLPPLVQEQPLVEALRQPRPRLVIEPPPRRLVPQPRVARRQPLPMHPHAPQRGRTGQRPLRHLEPPLAVQRQPQPRRPRPPLRSARRAAPRRSPQPQRLGRPRHPRQVPLLPHGPLAVPGQRLDQPAAPAPAPRSASSTAPPPIRPRPSSPPRSPRPRSASPGPLDRQRPDRHREVAVPVRRPSTRRRRNRRRAGCGSTSRITCMARIFGAPSPTRRGTAPA